MRVSIIFFLLMLTLLSCSKNDRENKNAYNIVAEAKFEKINEFYLLTNNTHFLGAGMSKAVLNNDIYIADRMKKTVFQYDIEGNFIRTIGNPGKGPGEFLDFPYFISQVGKNTLAVYSIGRINFYDINGKFLRNILTSDIKVSNIAKAVFDNHGNIYLINTSPDKISLDKINGSNEKEFSIQIVPDELQHIRSSKQFFFLCYNKTLNSIFYIYPTDYKINEIDAQNGVKKREFGIKPMSYQSVEKKYHYPLNSNPREFVKYIYKNIILPIGGINIIDDKYLVIGFGKTGGGKLEWIVYDLISSKKAYSIKSEIDNEIFSDNNRLFREGYITEAESEKYNGKIEEYRLVFN